MAEIYLAHNFAAREWLPKVVDRLMQAGHLCTSAWIFDDSHAHGGTMLESAMADLQGLDQAQVLVLFTDQYGDRPGKGKYAELGYALAKEKKVFLVGEDSGCVFYALPGITQVRDVDELLGALKREGYGN